MREENVAARGDFDTTERNLFKIMKICGKGIIFFFHKLAKMDKFQVNVNTCQKHD